MPEYGRISLENLITCHPDLQYLFFEVVKKFDCSIICGYRSPQTQFELFKRGRTYDEDKKQWVITNPLQIVTYKDGVRKKSKHEKKPTPAVDVIPYPIDWKDTNRMYFFAGYVKKTAEDLGVSVRWGGDWDGDTEIIDETFVDLPHWELL